ncbi:hypothetical protein TNCV_2816391 [Trichonephila clavipes]|nr:hypothetical protein TNCV_2816391 [Trichonephila clavipes]
MDDKNFTRFGRFLHCVAFFVWTTIQQELDNEDVQELLDFHSQMLTIDELLEIHEQERGIEELESLDPVQSKDRMWWLVI